jgi:polar amino acid transport system substrate-binding protein
MTRSTRVSAIVAAVVLLAACQATPADSPSGEPSTSTAANSAQPSSSASAAANVPPGGENTQITDWTDPRPQAWTDEYPLFAPITEVGDGSLQRVQEADNIIVCSALGLVPWNYIDPETNEVVGLEVDFLGYISEKLGLPEAEYQNVEFQALIPALQSHQCDVIMSSIGIRADRAEQVRFTVPYLLTYDQFIVDGDSGYTSADDMKGKRIGTFAGTADEDVLRAWVEAEGEGAEILTFNTPNECFLATQNGTIDACFTDNVAISAAITGEYSDLEALPDAFDYAAGFPEEAEGDPYRLLSIATATHLDDADLNLAFSVAIQEMIDDGTWQELVEQWGLYDENQGDGDFTRSDA